MTSRPRKADDVAHGVLPTRIFSLCRDCDKSHGLFHRPADAILWRETRGDCTHWLKWPIAGLYGLFRAGTFHPAPTAQLARNRTALTTSSSAIPNSAHRANASIRFISAALRVSVSARSRSRIYQAVGLGTSSCTALCHIAFEKRATSNDVCVRALTKLSASKIGFGSPSTYGRSRRQRISQASPGKTGARQPVGCPVSSSRPASSWRLSSPNCSNDQVDHHGVIPVGQRAARWIPERSPRACGGLAKATCDVSRQGDRRAH